MRIFLGAGQRYAALILFLLPLSACQVTVDTALLPAPASAPTTYTIPAGAHYTTQHPFKKVSLNTLKFKVTFNSSAIYTTRDPANQTDINKLYGVADCGTPHHTNSARFGWRWYNNQLELYAYTYSNGARNSVLVGVIKLDQPSICELVLEDKMYTFRMDGKQVHLPRACNGVGDGYQLYPYFGGDETAPHAISIAIEDI